MKRLLTSCFGLGWLPVAPGTWGSLPAAILFALICYFSTSAVIIFAAMLVFVLAGSVVCVKFAPSVITLTGNNDPSEVVADEFAGQAVAFLAVCSIPNNNIITVAVLGFLFFRFFDILKPWPIHRLEKLPKGWGILVDDLMAGVYAAVVLVLCRQFGLVDYLSSVLRFDSSSLNIFSAAVLGAVQGLTEFLPVSSSGHLVLFERFFGLNPEKPGMLLFDLTTHVGTVIAILIVFRKSIVSLVRNLAASGKYGNGPVEIYKRSPGVHFLTLAVITTFITGVMGMLLKEPLASARGSLVFVALMWIVTGTLLIITDMRKKARLGLRQFTIFAAMVVGLAQTAAILPGISRSGATICAAILLGLHRRWAVEFSFLIAIPAILGATAIVLLKDFAQLSSGGLPIGSVLTGTAVAALVGIGALKLLIKTSRKANLKVFAFYCYILACIVLLYQLK